MFKINKVHYHQRYEIVHEMTDDKDLNIGIYFIKHRKNNSDKAWDSYLANCSVRTVENSEECGGNKNTGILVFIYFFNSRLDVASHQKLFHNTGRKTGKNNQAVIVFKNV